MAHLDKPIYNQKIPQEIRNFNGKYCIYKITSPSSKVYIGQTKNIVMRMGRYRNVNIEQNKLFFSFKKYGFDAHKVEVLCVGENDTIDDLERHYIAVYDSFNNGLNSTIGGRNAPLTDYQRSHIRRTNAARKEPEESKNKRRETWKKYGYPMEGKKHSKESIEKMSISHKQRTPHPNTIKSLREMASKRIGEKREKWVIDKMLATKQEIYDKRLKDGDIKYPRKVPPQIHRDIYVVKYGDTGLIKTWRGSKLLAEDIGVSKNTVQRLADGRATSKHGHKVNRVKMYY